ncbi:MAG TPA: hydrogenase maturation protease [Terriglobales bacterium]|nr:hydrogenase maturation protease [Terriglobales bacterium]
MRSKVLVAGIGNIFLGDDAFGVEVIKRLGHRQLPPDVVVKDFGIRGYDLAYALTENWDLVILVDALARGGSPGTLYVLEPELPDTDTSAIALDGHAMNPEAVLQLATALGGHISRLLVVGCEPQNLQADDEGRIGLTAPVQDQVEEAIRMVEKLMIHGRSHAKVA